MICPATDSERCTGSGSPTCRGPHARHLSLARDRQFKIGALFSGYGGLDLAVEHVTGGETVCFSEINEPVARVFVHHWPDEPNLGDITTVDWSKVEPVDILVGGFPCQDVSAVGKGADLAPGARSGLWPHMAAATGEAVYSSLLTDPHRPLNAARFTYLDPTAKTFLRDWEQNAKDPAASLRQEAGRRPYDPELTELIGELSTRSQAFRRHWARHDVILRHHGLKRLRHPVVGDLDLRFDTLTLPTDPGFTMVVYTPAPDSPDSDALALLASWTETSRHELPSPGAPPSARIGVHRTPAVIPSPLSAASVAGVRR